MSSDSGEEAVKLSKLELAKGVSMVLLFCFEGFLQGLLFSL